MKVGQIVRLYILIACSYSCTQKEQTATKSERQDSAEWAELDSFHLIMAEAFHPYKDSTNLEPVKRLAEEMAQEAEKWASTSLPQHVNNDEMKTKLNQLKEDTRNLSELIKGGASDDEIGTSLEALHDSFHTIMEAWNDEESHEHQH